MYGSEGSAVDLIHDPCTDMSLLISFSNIDQTPLVWDPCSSKHAFFVLLRSIRAILEIGHMIISGESLVGSSVSAMSQASMIALSVTKNPASAFSVLGMVQVHEQIFVGDGEGGGHAEPKGAGKLDLRELFAVVVVV